MSSRDETATAVHEQPDRTDIQEAAQRSPMAARTINTTPVDEELSTRRLNIMRVGYAFMGVGLVIVKWPILLQGAAPSLPVFEGVVACLLTAMSLLAFLGLRYPTRMLPILLFEVTWKLLWLGVVVLPLVMHDQLDTATRNQAGTILWVVVIIAVIPWRHVLNQYVLAPGEPWRRGRHGTTTARRRRMPRTTQTHPTRSGANTKAPLIPTDRQGHAH